eukprot:scaffold20948_cov37-Cyclotella_meneghiniana.AAC.1
MESADSGDFSINKAQGVDKTMVLKDCALIPSYTPLEVSVQYQSPGGAAGAPARGAAGAAGAPGVVRATTWKKSVMGLKILKQSYFVVSRPFYNDVLWVVNHPVVAPSE